MENDILELSKIDYDFIKRMIAFSLSIENIYNRLYELEINGNKNTEEYSEYINYLKDTVVDYEKEFETFEIPPSKCRKYIDYLVGINTNISKYSTVESLVNQDYTNHHIRRIVNSLLLNSPHKSFILDGFIPKGSLSDFIHQEIEVKEELNNDGINGYICILQEILNNEPNNQIKNNLILSKYKSAFVNRKMESNMISSNFTPNEYFSPSANILVGFNQLDEFTFKKDTNQHFVNISCLQIERLLDMTDDSYKDVKVASTALLRACLLRSCFSFIDEGVLEELNRRYLQKIESSIYIETHNSDVLSNELISDAFVNMERDKGKQIILKFD